MSLESKESVIEKERDRRIMFQAFIQQSASRIDIPNILGSAILGPPDRAIAALRIEVERIIKNYHDSILKNPFFAQHMGEHFYGTFSEADNCPSPAEFTDCFRETIDELLPVELTD